MFVFHRDWSLFSFGFERFRRFLTAKYAKIQDWWLVKSHPQTYTSAHTKQTSNDSSIPNAGTLWNRRAFGCLLCVRVEIRIRFHLKRPLWSRMRKSFGTCRLFRSRTITECEECKKHTRRWLVCAGVCVCIRLALNSLSTLNEWIPFYSTLKKEMNEMCVCVFP